VDGDRAREAAPSERRSRRDVVDVADAFQDEQRCQAYPSAARADAEPPFPAGREDLALEPHELIEGVVPLDAERLEQGRPDRSPGIVVRGHGFDIRNGRGASG
jgi:hypothetical protein